jgi:hypothetical protein
VRSCAWRKSGQSRIRTAAGLSDLHAGDAARDEVHRIPRSRIRAIESQAISLMPERLLNVLTDAEIRDLLAFLDHSLGFDGSDGPRNKKMNRPAQSSEVRNGIGGTLPFARFDS